jgi:hypothetical protein
LFSLFLYSLSKIVQNIRFLPEFPLLLSGLNDAISVHPILKLAARQVAEIQYRNVQGFFNHSARTGFIYE